MARACGPRLEGHSVRVTLAIPRGFCPTNLLDLEEAQYSDTLHLEFRIGGGQISEN